MLPSRGDGYLTTADVARLVRRKPVTVRRWRSLGYLRTQGLDEKGRPLHTVEQAREALRIARENGIRTRGIDPDLQSTVPVPTAA